MRECERLVVSRLTCEGPFWNKDCSSSPIWTPYCIIISSSCGFIDSERQFSHGASRLVAVRCCSVLMTADVLTGWILRWLPHSQSQPGGCSRTASASHASPPSCDFSMCLAWTSYSTVGSGTQTRCPASSRWCAGRSWWKAQVSFSPAPEAAQRMYATSHWL